MSGDGATWASATQYLQDALTLAQSGDEIRVAEGTYKPDQGGGKTAGDRTATFNLVSGVNLSGGFRGDETDSKPLGDSNNTILSGEIDQNSSLWSLSVLVAKNISNTKIEGFRITKGKANANANKNRSNPEYYRGGGIFLLNSDMVSFEDCIFINNYALEGGGVYLGGTREYKVSFKSCLFIGNESGDGHGGGGIFNEVNTTMINCTLFNNKAGAGGGVYSPVFSVLKLVNVIFKQNRVDSHGGAIAATSSEVIAINTVFVENEAKAAEGGAIHWGGSKATFTNCIFYKNYAQNGGGAICDKGKASMNIHNSIFVMNQSGQRGGASIFYFRDNIPSINNSIFWGNSINGSPASHGIISHGEIHRNFPPGLYTKIFQHKVDSKFPGDPEAKDEVSITTYIYCNSINLLQNGGYENNFTSEKDPLFVNINDPDGLDDTWFTKDDGMRLMSNSPAINIGHNYTSGIDVSDIDTDGNIDEKIPLDLAGYLRIQNDTIDVGAYEFGEQRIQRHIVTISAQPSIGGTTTDSNLSIINGQKAQVTATANSGFVFSKWSGDANSSKNPLSINVDSPKNINAVFVEESFTQLNRAPVEYSSNRSASIIAYGLQVVLGPASLSTGSTVNFTTYDSSNSVPLNDNYKISSELKPITVGSSTYVADYIRTHSGYIVEYGSISLNMPSTDIDGNTVPDWLQLDMPCNVQVKGTSTLHWVAEGYFSSNANLSGVMTRESGEKSGKYTFKYDMPGLGVIEALGVWYASAYIGTAVFGSDICSISAVTTDTDGKTVYTSGTPNYKVKSQNEISFGVVNLSFQGSIVTLQPFNMTRQGADYVASLKALDGAPDTSWSDYNDWYFILRTSNDSDKDGVPNISDTTSDVKSFTSSVQLSNGWWQNDWLGSFFINPSWASNQSNKLNYYNNFSTNVFRGWVFHQDFLWIYVSSGIYTVDGVGSSFSAWMYFDNKGWKYTDGLIFPYLYDNKTNTWSYYDSSKQKPIYDFTTEEWKTISDI